MKSVVSMLHAVILSLPIWKDWYDGRQVVGVTNTSLRLKPMKKSKLMMIIVQKDIIS